LIACWVAASEILARSLYLPVVAAVAVRTHCLSLPYQMGHSERKAAFEKVANEQVPDCLIHFAVGISVLHPGTAAQQRPCWLERHPSC
jgi:hypothetical protein